MGVKRYFMNEKEADVIRKSMYESLLMDENDKIVHWDFDPMRRELRHYVDIACGCDEQTYGIRTPQFEYRYCTGKIKMPFAKSDYLANDDIIATVMGLGLDVEKFWFALVFIYDYVETSFKNCGLVKPASLDKAVQNLFKELGEDFTDDDIEITLKKNRKKVEVLPVIKRGILHWLRETYERECKGRKIHYYGIDTGNFDETYPSTSFRIYRTVEMYRDMLNTLLGDNRPKQPDKSVSLNRLLLISRICYLYEFTYNDSFLYSDDSLKGIIKSCKGRMPATYSAVYL